MSNTHENTPPVDVGLLWVSGRSVQMRISAALPLCELRTRLSSLCGLVWKKEIVELWPRATWLFSPEGTYWVLVCGKTCCSTPLKTAVRFSPSNPEDPFSGRRIRKKDRNTRLVYSCAFNLPVKVHFSDISGAVGPCGYVFCFPWQLRSLWLTCAGGWTGWVSPKSYSWGGGPKVSAGFTWGFPVKFLLV